MRILLLQRDDLPVGCVPTSESSKCLNMYTALPKQNMFCCSQSAYRLSNSLVCRTKLS